MVRAGTGAFVPCSERVLAFPGELQPCQGGLAGAKLPLCKRGGVQVRGDWVKSGAAVWIGFDICKGGTGADTGNCETKASC